MITRVLATVLTCLLLLGAGVYLGGHPEGLPGPVRDALVGDQDTRVVQEAIDEVRDTYYRDIPRDQLADESIRGLVKSLDDRFSNYFDPKEYAQFKQSQDSEFEGVGISVSQHPRGLRIAEVFDGSPAKRAGIEAGDVVIAVNGRSLKGRSQDQSVALIKGQPGTDVRLTLLHDGKERSETLTRSTISVPVVASKMETVDGTKLGVVRLAQFSSGAHAEVYAAIRRALDKGAKGIVFDLRHNGGGLVTEAQLVASAFLEKGKIVTTKGRSVPERSLSATGDAVAGKTPLVVLVDRDTASASEIVAGALQDYGRAELVGTRTYGKGVFQQVIELSNGGALDITAGQYFTPKGRNLGGKGTAQGAGLAPDVKAQDDPKTPKDEALATALRTLQREAA
ncbi:MAG: S41 family peptidase [Solirubrobacterales bacterium]|nr:S41 family peptidase [Solirubrobacterales bacterium]